MSPPPKRMRGGWGDEDRYGGYDDGYERDFYDRPPPPPRHYSRPSKPKDEDLEGFQPAMMSFKSFLQTQDDQISDEEAIKKYAEYKLEFKRQQLNEFFVTHKEEEWFKQKYHPDESVKRKDELREFLKKRVEVFQEFLEQGKIQDLPMDCDVQDNLIRILDSVVIKLEGGTDFDLKSLDLPDIEEEGTKKESSRNGKSETREDQNEENSAVVNKAKEMLEFLETPKNEESKKRKREEDETEDQEEEAEKEKEVQEKETEDENKDKEEAEGEVEGEEKTEEDKEMEDAEKKEDESFEDEKKDDKKIDDDEKDDEKDVDMKDSEEESSPKPRALHKTSSIFLRNLPPTVTKQEVEAMCRRYDGFLRSAIADPAPDRRWFRRGWVTFKRTVKIKDICYNLNNTRLRDCELGPIVNRDLTKRVRTVPGLTQDRKVVRNDIKLAAKIITNLDTKWNLWRPEGDPEDVSLGLVSANPLLANITDYLIEEASAEEEELLGRSDDTVEKDEGVTLQRDEELIKVLDKMILYLRIVHSVDFYNHSEYPNEDEMPNRCGILHARGALPAGKTKSSEIEEYMTTFEKKMGGFLVLRGELTDEDAGKLGLKNEQEEVEKFISANTQELGKVSRFTLTCYMLLLFFVSGQMALSSLRKEVQRSGLCEKAHPDKAHREDRGGQEGGQFLQQLLEGGQYNDMTMLTVDSPVFVRTPSDRSYQNIPTRRLWGEWRRPRGETPTSTAALPGTSPATLSTGGRDTTEDMEAMEATAGTEGAGGEMTEDTEDLLRLGGTTEATTGPEEAKTEASAGDQ